MAPWKFSSSLCVIWHHKGGHLLSTWCRPFAIKMTITGAVVHDSLLRVRECAWNDQAQISRSSDQVAHSSDQGQILCYDKPKCSPWGSKLLTHVLGDCITTHVFYWELMCVHIHEWWFFIVPSKMVLYLNPCKRLCIQTSQVSGKIQLWLVLGTAVLHIEGQFLFMKSVTDKFLHWTGKLLFILLKWPSQHIRFILIAWIAYLHV